MSVMRIDIIGKEIGKANRCSATSHHIVECTPLADNHGALFFAKWKHKLTYSIFFRRLEQELSRFQDRVKLLDQRNRNKSSGHQDLQLCRLCFKTKFADGVGRLCHDCQQRVCNRCGSFTKNSTDNRRSRVGFVIFLRIHKTNIL